MRRICEEEKKRQTCRRPWKMFTNWAEKDEGEKHSMHYANGKKRIINGT